MYIEPTLLATATGVIGATLAAVWSYLMASKVAAPRAKRLIVEALTQDGPEVQAVRAALIEPALEASYARIDAQTASGGTQVAQTVENAVNEALEAFNDELGSTISNHVYQAINQVRAQETKSLQAQLEDLNIPGVTEEMKAAVSEQLPPQLVQAQRLLQMKVSKKYASEHPLEAQAIEAGKLWVMQMMNGGMLGGIPSNGGQRADASIEKNRGFGVR